jgi:hypothetical protein
MSKLPKMEQKLSALKLQEINEVKLILKINLYYSKLNPKL